MVCTLKNYDTELMTFELTQKLLERFICQIFSARKENKHLLPPGMTVGAGSVLSRFEFCILPSNKGNSERILPVYGLTCNNIPGIIQLCQGVPLNGSCNLPVARRKVLEQFVQKRTGSLIDC